MNTFESLYSAALPAGGSVWLEAGRVNGANKRLVQVRASASVALRVEVLVVKHDVPTPLDVGFTSSGHLVYEWNPPEMTASNAEGASFQVHLINMDNSLAGDVYATVVWR